MGKNEKLIGEALKDRRDQFFLASKCVIGFENGKRFIDGRPERIKQACEDSLERLQTDRIDLYYMARLKQQGGEPLRIGNFDDARDFGSADEFTRAMFEVLSLDTPTDFVFATGVTTPLKKLIKYAAVHAGFSPVFEGKGLSTRCFDKETGLELAYASPDFFRPSGTPPLVGNPSRLRAATTFEGKTDVKGLMAEMVEADLKRRLHHQDL